MLPAIDTSNRSLDQGVLQREGKSPEAKDTLDPFLPEKPADVERIKAIQRDVHDEFISLVKERRGARLDKGGDGLFSGAFWSGRKALELGLIDGLADLYAKMHEVYGDEVRFKLVAPSTSLATSGPKRRAISSFGTPQSSCTSWSSGIEILPSGRTGTTRESVSFFHTVTCSTSPGPIT